MMLSQIKTVAALVLLGAAGCLIAGYSWAIAQIRADQPPGAKSAAVITPGLPDRDTKKIDS